MLGPGKMPCGHCGFQKPDSEFLSLRKEGEAARVSGVGLTGVWLREAVVGAGWWEGRAPRLKERHRERETSAHFGAAGDNDWQGEETRQS